MYTCNNIHKLCILNFFLKTVTFLAFEELPLLETPIGIYYHIGLYWSIYLELTIKNIKHLDLHIFMYICTHIHVYSDKRKTCTGVRPIQLPGTHYCRYSYVYKQSTFPPSLKLLPQCLLLWIVLGIYQILGNNYHHRSQK